MHNKASLRTSHRVLRPENADVETEALRGEEAEPREAFFLPVQGQTS